MRHWRQRVFIIITTTALVLSGCGFHLRGDYLISPQLQTLYINSQDPFGELTRIVKRHFTQHKIHLLKHSAENKASLLINQDKLDRRALSVFNNGQVAEYELIYTVQYQVTLPNGESKAFTLELNRDYQDDPDNTLAKSRELALLLSELRHQAADKMLRTLASIQTD